MSLVAIVCLVLIPCVFYIGIVYFTKYNSSRHWSSIPGFCMGIGIAVTFGTMYLTFQDKVKVLNIASLIPEISKAFIGSLLGLGLSLIMTYWIKSRISTIEENEQKKAGENNNPYLLLQQINENTLATYLATVQLFNESNNQNKSIIYEVSQSRKILKEFTDKTEQFNTNLFNELIQKLEKAVRDMSNEAIGKSLGNIEDIQKDLAEELKTIFGTTNGTIAVGQTDLKNSIDELKVALETKIKDINDASTKSAGLAQEEVNKLLTEISNKVANMGESITTQADTVITQKVESINNTFNAIDEKQQKAVEIQGDIVKEMQDIFTKMETAFNTKIDEINIATNEIQGKIIEMGNNITEKADKIVDSKIQSLEENFERIEQYQRRSETMLKEVTSSFKKAVEKYEQVNEDKTELIGIIGQQLKELQEVRENGMTLIENWNGIAKTMESMQDRINQINNVITQLDNIKTVLANQQTKNHVQ